MTCCWNDDDNNTQGIMGKRILGLDGGQARRMQCTIAQVARNSSYIIHKLS